ncbi:ATP-binding protein [Dolichospermum sp. ST_sed5]|nr:ATP-binding protein [Dolichospermum sp. ST_sed5]
MQINVEGRIKNVNLPYSKPLYPLFEAVVNSIHAIEELNSRNGMIRIFIERDKSQGLLGLLHDNTELCPIKSFRIEDNGIGFNEPNYNAFLTADTTYKAETGGKGIGRFIWLKAFEYAHIESTFHEDGGFKKELSISFLPSNFWLENCIEIK